MSVASSAKGIFFLLLFCAIFVQFIYLFIYFGYVLIVRNGHHVKTIKEIFFLRYIYG